MRCKACGSNLRDGARICLACGEMVKGKVAAGDRLEAAPAGVPSWIALKAPANAEVSFGAGRLQRLLAYVADSLILGGAGWLLALPFGGLDVAVTSEGRVEGVDLRLLVPLLVVQCGYFILFAASQWQGTPGKRLMGLRITTLEDGPLTIFSSVGRFLYQQLWLLVGFPLTLYAVSFSPWAIFPFVACIATAVAVWILCGNGRSPWDWMAGTKVVE